MELVASIQFMQHIIFIGHLQQLNCRLRGKSQCDVNHSQSIHFQSIRCETIIHLYLYVYWLWCGEERTNKNVNTFYDGIGEMGQSWMYFLILFIARKGWTDIENEWMDGCEKHIGRLDARQLYLFTTSNWLPFSRMAHRFQLILTVSIETENEMCQLH